MLGKLLGSLLPIGLVLVGMLPVLALLLLLGGITPEQVINAWLVLLATSLAAGSLGGLVALWRDKTFQALALSVLALVLYVCAVQALGCSAYFADPRPRRRRFPGPWPPSIGRPCRPGSIRSGQC